mgnify:FL=1
MYIKNLVDEDFVNYKVVSMFIGCYSCSFKCDKLSGRQVCQNGALANSPNIKISVGRLVERYLNNPLSNAVVFGGLEPFEDIDNVVMFIDMMRSSGNNDDIVIYTGYTEEEITINYQNYYLTLQKYPNIIIKYGRFVPDQKAHFDEVLGVNLQSDNQYAKKIS